MYKEDVWAHPLFLCRTQIFSITVCEFQERKKCPPEDRSESTGNSRLGLREDRRPSSGGHYTVSLRHMSLQNVISRSGILQVSCPNRACRCVSSRGCSGCVSIRPELLCLPLCTCGCQGAERHTWCRTSCGCGRESQ